MKNFKKYLFFTLFTANAFANSPLSFIKNESDLLSELRPIIIVNAKENITCTFESGNPNSFHPFDEIIIKFSNKGQIPTYLRNTTSMTAWGGSSAHSLSANENIKVSPEDCPIILERIFLQVNPSGELVLPGLRKFSIYNKTRLIESHYGSLNLGEPLHNNPPESMLVSLGSSIYIDLHKNIPTNINNFSYLSGNYTGSYKFHPQAASYVGLNCIPSTESKNTFILMMTPMDSSNVARITNVRVPYDLSYDSCINHKNSLLKYSENVDPKNNGEIISANEILLWDPNSFDLTIDIDISYKNTAFTNTTVIHLK